jgi:uncharacterized protein YndB with AHSA1/START domain
MPTVRRSRTIPAPVHELWEVIRDPYHLPRWWPRVTRVEAVDGDAFTEVLTTSRGRAVRADFRLVQTDASSHTLTWAQQVEGTPFARVLQAAETEVRLEPHTEVRSGRGGEDGRGSTSVTIELRQTMARGRVAPGGTVGGGGFFTRFGSPIVRRAASATLEEALDGLERIVG